MALRRLSQLRVNELNTLPPIEKGFYRAPNTGPKVSIMSCVLPAHNGSMTSRTSPWMEEETVCGPHRVEEHVGNMYPANVDG
ncbi:hypothetical protein L195_g004448 [Trifolium pratense]|uniref:Uncharacterized protein n=1 Tax=Trifolium pratense TaxID=57577 RepID=A0A2K3NY24_TRIPR|nr:hypothetical protein L195_g004448 [Trifolium pratense]